MQQYNELIKEISNSGYKETILTLLDEVKNYIADARNGDYTTETRKASIEAIDRVLYNKIKSVSNGKQDEPEEWL